MAYGDHVLTFHCVVRGRMKVEGALRCLKSFWNPEVSLSLHSLRSLRRIALNFQLHHLRWSLASCC